MNPHLLEEIEVKCREIFKPRPKQTVVEWAETNLNLREGRTEVPGPYSTSLTPYVREPLNDFAENSVTDLVFCFGTQTAKTTIIMVGVSYRIDLNPSPIVWVLPNETLARSFSETRWQPLVDDSPALVRHKPSDLDKYKILEMQFDRCPMTFVGSNSPSNLASRPAGILVCDETDKFAQATAKEASALALAENRTKAFANALRIKTSTPTTEFGEIWQEFLKGDQRYYYVPCPHCDHKQTLVWEQVKWDQNAKNENGKWDSDKVKRSAYYECISCKDKILDAHKTIMIRKGQWQPSNLLAEKGRRSYHLNSLYAPWASCTFGSLAVKFLQDKETINGLQDFINSTLALPWKEKQEELTELPVFDYRLGDLWEQEHKRIMTIDAQRDHYWIVIRAWSKIGVSRLIWSGKAITIEDVYDIQLKNGVKPGYVGIDSGDRANEIYTYCVRFNWLALKGDDQKSFAHIQPNGPPIYKAYSTETYQDTAVGTREQNRITARAMLVRWSNPTIKDLLYQLQKHPEGLWTVSIDHSEDYKLQMAAVVKREFRRPTDGKIIFKWITWDRKNGEHLHDCECMNLVCALKLGLIKFTIPGQKFQQEDEAQ
jgi:hypothetical protein